MARRWSVCICLLGLATLAPVCRGEDAAARSGMEAHVDPETGSFVPEPVAPAPSRPIPAPLPPLAEVPGPRGGMVVDLQGRFLSTTVATLNPDGSARIECVPADRLREHEAPR